MIQLSYQKKNTFVFFVYNCLCIATSSIPYTDHGIRYIFIGVTKSLLLPCIFKKNVNVKLIEYYIDAKISKLTLHSLAFYFLAHACYGEYKYIVNCRKL